MASNAPSDRPVIETTTQVRRVYRAHSPPPLKPDASLSAGPVLQIVGEPAGGQMNTIELILGDHELSHLSHVIDRPTALRFERLWFNGVRLLISDASGTSTLLEIAAAPQAIEALVAASQPF
jgi:hypothetical protein